MQYLNITEIKKQKERNQRKDEIDKLKLKVDKARKAFFVYQTHSNFIKWQNIKKELNFLIFN